MQINQNQMRGFDQICHFQRLRVEHTAGRLRGHRVHRGKSEFTPFLIQVRHSRRSHQMPVLCRSAQCIRYVALGRERAPSAQPGLCRSVVPAQGRQPSPQGNEIFSLGPD